MVRKTLVYHHKCINEWAKTFFLLLSIDGQGFVGLDARTIRHDVSIPSIGRILIVHETHK